MRGSSIPTEPLERLYSRWIRDALEEDLGSSGDRTTVATVDLETRIDGDLVARAAGRICGLEIALATFQELDPGVEASRIRGDGSDVGPGESIARVRGRAHALLAAERTALNFLGHLSGIATATRDLVARIERFGATLTCTRKTTPGLRLLEKYAVRVGGGANHRLGLYDAILIKDNHRQLAGGVMPALRRARARVGTTIPIEVEVDTLDQLYEAVAGGADMVLLDNMSLDDLRVAVALCRGRAVTEASGGIGPHNIGDVAATGVDRISAGWITHSAPSLDIGFDLDFQC